MAQLFAQPFYTAFDTNGEPISGAKAYFYATGTTTPQSVYTSAALTTAHASPVVADSAGRFAAIFLNPDQTYRFDLKDASGALIKTVDPINESLAAELAATTGADLIGWSETGPGAEDSNVGDELRRGPIHAWNYGVVGDGVNDDTAAVEAVAARGISEKRPVVYRGTPLLTSTVDFTDGDYSMEGRPGNFAGRLPDSYFIKGAACNGPAVKISGQAVSFKQLAVIGTAGNTGDGAQITGHSVRLFQPYFGGTFGTAIARGDALRIGEDGTAVPNTNGFYLQNPCIDATCKRGIYVHDGDGAADYPNANAGLIVKPEIRNCEEEAILAGNSFAVTLLAPLLEANEGPGLRITRRALAWVVIGGDMEGNTSGSAATDGSDLIIDNTEFDCTFTDAGDLVTTAGHGLSDGSPIQFSAIETTTGISVSTTYYARDTTASTFKVAATSGGAAIALTTNGNGTWHEIAAGGDRGQHQIIGTNLGAPPLFTNVWQTTVATTGYNGFAASSGPRPLNASRSYTPELRCATSGSFAGTFVARELKQDRRVTVDFRFDVTSATGTPTGAILIGPLRYQIASGQPVTVSVGRYSYLALPASRYNVGGTRSDSSARWIKLVAGGLTDATPAANILGESQGPNFTSAGVMELTVTYWSAD